MEGQMIRNLFLVFRFRYLRNDIRADKGDQPEQKIPGEQWVPHGGSFQY